MVPFKHKHEGHKQLCPYACLCKHQGLDFITATEVVQEDLNCGASLRYGAVALTGLRRRNVM